MSSVFPTSAKGTDSKVFGQVTIGLGTPRIVSGLGLVYPWGSGVVTQNYPMSPAYALAQEYEGNYGSAHYNEKITDTQGGNETTTKGLNGVSGTSGAAGQDGADGEDGADGADGANGTKLTAGDGIDPDDLNSFGIVTVLPTVDKGLEFDASTPGTLQIVTKATGGVTVDGDGVQALLKSTGGISTDATGFQLKLKAGSGLKIDADGLFIDFNTDQFEVDSETNLFQTTLDTSC